MAEQAKVKRLQHPAIEELLIEYDLFEQALKKTQPPGWDYRGTLPQFIRWLKTGEIK